MKSLACTHASYRRILLLGLLLLPLASVRGADKKSPADRFWEKAMKATESGKWDLARAILLQFASRFGADPRAEEARLRASGNAFLADKPYCLNGPADASQDGSFAGGLDA